jgi:hypothetical protein
MSDPLEQDAAVLGHLGKVFDLVDPVAPFVGEAGRTAYSWRRVDAELAELLSDSATEKELAGARRSGASVRSVVFSLGTLTIDLEIRADGASVTLLGQLSPPAVTELELQTPRVPAAFTTRTDELGQFRVHLPDAGAVRLRVLDRAGPSPRWVETGWVGL